MSEALIILFLGLMGTLEDSLLLVWIFTFILHKIKEVSLVFLLFLNLFFLRLRRKILEPNEGWYEHFMIVVGSVERVQYIVVITASLYSIHHMLLIRLI